MFNSVSYSNEAQTYYNNKYASTPVNAENKIAYKIKKGDNLWNIAKDHLNKKNASNAEISDMVYKIAKLNNKKSLEAANNIKVNDVIYLPGEQKSNPQRTSAAVAKQVSDPVKHAYAVSDKINDIITPKENLNYSQKALYKLQHISDIPESLYKEHAQAGVGYWDKTLSDPKNKFVISKSTSYSPVIYTGLSVIKKEDNNPYGRTESHLYIEVDGNGKVKELCYNVPGADVRDTSFDYKIDTNGNLYRNTGMFNNYKKIGQLSPAEYKALMQDAQQCFDKNVSNRIIK